MFVYRDWEKFCKRNSTKFNFIRVDQIPSQSLDSEWVSIKHDVETSVSKALDIAKIEAKYGIQSTYFVQSYLLKDNVSLLKGIARLGHEVTYHYDVLDSNNGNYEKANSEFEETIKQFCEAGFEVKTICPHGNPLIERDGWFSNKDFFRDKSIVKQYPDIFDVVVQGEGVIGTDYFYISDAGYGWKLISNIKNNDINNEGDKVIGNLDKVAYQLEGVKKAIISSHPHRWSNSYLKAFTSHIVFKVARFFVRLFSRVGFIKKFLSRFYYLAKKI